MGLCAGSSAQGGDTWLCAGGSVQGDMGPCTGDSLWSVDTGPCSEGSAGAPGSGTEASALPLPALRLRPLDLVSYPQSESPRGHVL